MALTAAQRAARFRAKREAERDALVTSRAVTTPAIEAVLGEVLAELRAIRSALTEVGYPQPAPVVTPRDATARHAVQRDATKRHETEGAPAPTRVRARFPAPTGPGEPYAADRDVTPAELVLGVVRRSPASAGALADALDIPTAAIVAALADLQRAGLVRRTAGATPADRDRWAPVPVESPAETIRCDDYHGHQLTGHRRDPATGRFRCFICDPDAVAGGLHA